MRHRARVAVLAAALLAGCGSDGGDASSESTDTTTTTATSTEPVPAAPGTPASNLVPSDFQIVRDVIDADPALGSLVNGRGADSMTLPVYAGNRLVGAVVKVTFPTPVDVDVFAPATECGGDTPVVRRVRGTGVATLDVFVDLQGRKVDRVVIAGDPCTRPPTE